MSSAPRSADNPSVPIASVDRRPSVVMLCGTRTTGPDAILEYARDLAVAARSAFRTTLRVRDGRGRWHDDARPVSLEVVLRDLSRADVALLHYNPFSWGHRGFAPSIVRLVRGVRRTTPVALMAHECFVDPRGLRGTVMHSWQHYQFVALARMARVAFASTDAWSGRLASAGATLVSGQPLPISSSLPDGRADRDATRTELGVSNELVIAAYGMAHPSRRVDLIARAVAAVGQDREVVFLNLGAGSPPVGQASGVRTVTPGWLEPDDLARHLACADLFVAPFIDGVSLRRTTVMAAMQQAVAIVGTIGVNTDAALADAWPWPEMLVPAGDDDRFIACVLAAANDADGRERAAAAGRALYAARFDWPAAVCVLASGLQRAGIVPERGEVAAHQLCGSA